MKMIIKVTLVAVLGVAQAIAVDTTWDGAGTPDDSGEWGVAVNWNTDAVPTTNDLAILPSVTSGTRTITQDAVAGTTNQALRMVQSGTTTATNKLSLNGNLQFTKASREAATPDSATSAFQVSLVDGATNGQVVVDLNGHAIIFTTSGGGATCGGSVGGVINYGASGSSIHSTVSGHTAFNIFGVLDVTADGRLGRDTGGANATGNGSIAMKAGAVLAVTNATFAFELAGKRGQDRLFSVFNAGTIQVAAGATLAQLWTAPASSGNRGAVVFENQAAGAIRLAGTAAFRVHHAVGATNAPLDIRNYGLWRISGASAVIRRLTTSQDASYIAVPSFINAATGILQGDTAGDLLEFDEDVADGSRRISMISYGRVAPGAGSQGSAMTSVGTLRLRDINLTVETNSTVVLDFGGAAVGQHDRLLLEAGATDPAGAGTLGLAGGTLQLHTVNGFTPASSFAVDLIAAGSVTGAFATVKLDGDTFTENALVVPDVGTYVLSYASDTVRLQFAAVYPSGTVIEIR